MFDLMSCYFVSGSFVNLSCKLSEYHENYYCPINICILFISYLNGNCFLSGENTLEFNSTAHETKLFLSASLIYASLDF